MRKLGVLILTFLAPIVAACEVITLPFGEQGKDTSPVKRSFDDACYPVIAVYQGYGAKKIGNTDLRQSIARRNVNQCKVLMFSHDKGRESIQRILQIYRPYMDTKNQTRIALIGYSWGGDTAHTVAGTLSRRGFPTLLITLDPVSTMYWERRLAGNEKNFPNPTDEWLNIYAFSGAEGARAGYLRPEKVLRQTASCDEYATVGGAWGWQKKATMSISIGALYNDQRNHCRVDEMLLKALAHVNVLSNCQCNR